MNYVGPFYAAVAGLTLLSLFFGAGILRKIALVIAVFAFPSLMLFYYGFFRNESEFPLFYDIETNTSAALELYDGSGDVYGVEGSYSFPFPTYFFYWAATGFDSWGKSGVFLAFTLMGATVWLASLYLLRGELRSIWESFPQWRELVLIAVLCIPAGQAVGQGQTATFVLLCLTLFYLSLKEQKYIWLGGMALAFAGMFKPQLALIPAGLLVYGWVKPAVRGDLLRAYLGMAGGMVLLIGLTLLLPKGVRIHHYEEFFWDVLPNLTPPTREFKVHGSPAFLVSVGVMRANGDENLASLLATLTTILLVAALAWKTFHWAKSDYPLGTVAAMWAVWAIFAPQQSWNFYAAWGLPAFILILGDALSRPNSRPRLSLILVTLSLLNIQVAHTPLAVVAMSGFAYLVWTYHKPTP